MTGMIDWLNINAAAVGAFASVVIMFTTMVYAWLTSQLAKENRLLRKAGTEPQVAAFVTINPRVYGAIDFVIANIGRGPAHNVSFKIVAGGDDFSAKGVHFPHEGIVFSILPQSEQITTVVGMGFDLLADPALKPFDVRISYENQNGEKQVRTFQINVSSFEGLRRLGKPAEHEIAESVTKIADEIGGWAHRRLQIEMMTVSERRVQDEESRRWVEERKARRGQQAGGEEGLD